LAAARGVDGAIVLSTAAIPEAFRALRRNGHPILVGLSTSSYEFPHVHTHAIEDTKALLEQLRRGELAGRAVIEFC
jgi:D-arabinose 1-dehydrogenase-like Zn-dependent alcohol dehydrogenase